MKEVLRQDYLLAHRKWRNTDNIYKDPKSFAHISMLSCMVHEFTTNARPGPMRHQLYIRVPFFPMEMYVKRRKR
jgi:hypothetical protein